MDGGSPYAKIHSRETPNLMPTLNWISKGTVVDRHKQMRRANNQILVSKGI